MNRYLKLVLRSEEIEQDFNDGLISKEVSDGRMHDLENDWEEYWDEH